MAADAVWYRELMVMTADEALDLATTPEEIAFLEEFVARHERRLERWRNVVRFLGSF